MIIAWLHLGALSFEGICDTVCASDASEVNRSGPEVNTWWTCIIFVVLKRAVHSTLKIWVDIVLYCCISVAHYSHTFMFYGVIPSHALQYLEVSFESCVCVGGVMSFQIQIWKWLFGAVAHAAQTCAATFCVISGPFGLLPFCHWHTWRPVRRSRA